MRQNGNITSFDVTGSVYTLAVCINADSTISGFYGDSANLVHWVPPAESV